MDFCDLTHVFNVTFNEGRELSSVFTFNESPVVGSLDYFHFFTVASNTVVDILINSSLLHAAFYYNKLLEVQLLQQKVFAFLRLCDPVFSYLYAL